MPDGAERTDKLNRAVERIAAGQPTPVLDDPDLEHLAQLASYVRRTLPRDLPDPNFRVELKSDLINPHPKLMPLPARHAPRRYPVGAFVGALLAVMISSVVVGWLAFAPDTSGRNLLRSERALANVTQPAITSTIAASIATATPRPTMAAEIVLDQTPLSPASPAGEPAGESSQQVTAPTFTPQVVFTATPAPAAQATEMNDATEPTAPIDRVPGPTPVPPTPSPEPTRTTASADLPPVDREHIALGALATAPAGEPISENVTFSLMTEIPQLAATAPVYRFLAPNVEASMLIHGIAQVLQLEAEIQEVGEFGRMLYTVASESGNYFAWSPSSGAFSCRMRGQAAATETANDIVEAALSWLRRVGYPVDASVVTPTVEQNEAGDWVVDIPLGEVPDPAIGHPLTVKLTLQADGTVVAASGYWLKISSSQERALMGAEAVWQALLDGRGFWPSGFNPQARGEFQVESLEVSYVLTLGQDGEVVLQPVVSVGGTFVDVNGNVTPDIRVLVQAAAPASS